MCWWLIKSCHHLHKFRRDSAESLSITLQHGLHTDAVHAAQTRTKRSTSDAAICSIVRSRWGLECSGMTFSIPLLTAIPSCICSRTTVPHQHLQQRLSHQLRSSLTPTSQRCHGDTDMATSTHPLSRTQQCCRFTTLSDRRSCCTAISCKKVSVSQMPSPKM